MTTPPTRPQPNLIRLKFRLLHTALSEEFWVKVSHVNNTPPLRQAVLIVDDDPDTVSSLSRLLRQQGYETDSSGTISDALGREDWERFLAVILDRRLPDGVIDDFLHDFRERDPDIAIVIATGYSDICGTIAALREQVEDYLIKPIDPELLRARLQRIAENREANQKMRLLEQEVIRISEEEKQRIAMDIHDGLGSMLGGIGLLCCVLADKLKSVNRPDEAEQALEIEGLIKEAIVQARALSRGLHSVGSHPSSLKSALEDLARGVSRSGKVCCQCVAPETQEVHDQLVANHLFRIAQEAVNNALKHSECSEINIELTSTDYETKLRIHDDGTGISDADKGSGIGLHTMEYRARAIGGRFSVSNGDTCGTEVHCLIPKRKASAG